MTKIINSFLLLGVLFSGCSVVSKTTTQSSPSPSIAISDLPTPFPNMGFSPRATHQAILLSPTVTPQSLPTSTTALTEEPLPTPSQTLPLANPTSSLYYQCLNVDLSLQANQTADGILVFNTDGNLDAYLYNSHLESQVHFPRLEYERLHDFNVSPNGRMIFYHGGIEGSSYKNLYISDGNGRQLWMQSETGGSFVWDWFDNERLVNLIPQDDGVHSLLLINPFTGSSQELPRDYPQIFRPGMDFFHWRFNAGFVTMYDPTLTRVIYPECDDECWDVLLNGAEDIGNPIVLWNTQTGEKVLEWNTFGYGRTPLWSVDGQWFVISVNPFGIEPIRSGNFFLVHRDGTIRQLTHFDDFFTYADVPDNYTLSPDQKRLAFWLLGTPGEFLDARLAVMDIETGNVINYCLRGEPFRVDAFSNSYQPASPIWSPDSTQLLIVDRDPNDETRRRVILVDIVNNYAAVIAENVEPVGWMVAP